MKKALSKHRQEQPGKRPELVVAMYCKSGKHRSVAVSKCLRHVCASVEGFEVEVLHISAPTWRRVCLGDEGACLSCSSFAEVKKAALWHAEQIWHEGV